MINKKIIHFPILIFLMISLTCASSNVKSKNDSSASPDLINIIKIAWKNICSSGSKCDTYDYFPDGGMRNFYCHLLNYISYDKFVNLLGVPIFKKGPHSEKGLNLISRNSFGYYNPLFVIKIRNILIPGEEDKIFKNATKPVYDKCIKKLARIYFVSYRKLLNNPEYFRKEKISYLKKMQSGGLDSYFYEKYFYFMNKKFFIHSNESYLMKHGFDGGWNGNVVKTAVAFWLRRSIDGTAEEFHRGLVKLLNTYDEGFMEKHMDI